MPCCKQARVDLTLRVTGSVTLREISLSSSTMQSRQRTRQPLSEITVDHTKAIKRPLSPSTTLLSPSKRRFLAVEGVSLSPRRIPKGTLPPEFLIPHSPSTNKPPKNRALGPPPSKQNSQIPTTLSPSPQITLSQKHSASVGKGIEPLPTFPDPPLLIPRELPPIADRQSIHWPGFDVHCDTHVSNPVSSSSRSSDQASLTNSESDSEKSKENVKPRHVTSKRRGASDINPFKDDRPSPKVFSPSSIFSTIQSNADEEAIVEQLL